MTALNDLHTYVSYLCRNYGHRHRYWLAKAHRARLIDSGQYIKTSEQHRLTISWTTVVPRSFDAAADAWGDIITISRRDS